MFTMYKRRFYNVFMIPEKFIVDRNQAESIKLFIFWHTSITWLCT